MANQFLPLFYRSKGKKIQIFGAGRIALRRCKKLLPYCVELEVISPQILPELETLLKQAGQAYTPSRFSPDLIQAVDFVIAATDERHTNSEIAELCKSKKIPVNVIDNPKACDFIFPMIVDREPLSIAISSGGSSPILSRLLKNLIHGLIPASYGRLATLVGRFRNEVRDTIPDEKKRVRFWETILQGPIAEMVFAGKEENAEKHLKLALEDVSATTRSGEVYLIGAGPGDPNLLTLRAFRLIQQSDVILYDRLVSDAVMELAREDAELIYVGKKRSFHKVPQDEINQLLIDHARTGKRVARLKGGDPFIFGRGGEEIEQLAEHAIPFQVVPGISAANGCAAYAGIPLTHRDHAQSVRFVTGQLKDGTVDLPWAELVIKNQTVVFYMGLQGLSVICQQLIEHGADPTLPAALISQGSTRHQQTIVASLANLAETVAQLSVKSPTLLIVGEVVGLHEKLAWYQTE